MTVAITPHGAVELKDATSNQIFFVNSQYVRHYCDKDTSKFKKAIDLANDE